MRCYQKCYILFNLLFHSKSKTMKINCEFFHHGYINIGYYIHSMILLRQCLLKEEILSICNYI